MTYDGSGNPIIYYNSDTYTYDSSGNITRITDQSGNVTRYTYDKLGQLTREDNPYLGKTYVYAYDKAGNRTSKTTYDYTTGTLGSKTATKEYEYTGDQLSGTTYDEIGNPKIYNGYDLTWNGRQLMVMDMNAGQFRYSFTYNDEGIRTSKTYGSTTHYYTLNGSQIVTETWVTKTQDGEEIVEHPNHFLVYLYDESGAPIGLQYRNKTYEKYDFDTYYFEKNLQGDIIAIYTEAGTKIGSYTYDAWGNCTCSYATGATPTQKKIVQMFNPFRYRGYYYDYDTGLYYLQSRYYNPTTGRFINADGYVNANGDLIGFNMYAYCGNNPVMYTDRRGENKGYSYDYTYDLGGGYTARFDRGHVGNGDHVHVTNGDDEWVMNLDGSISHENRTSSGNPPKKRLKRLKELTGFDYEKIRNNYLKKSDVLIGFKGTTCVYEYPDGTKIWDGVPHYTGNDINPNTEAIPFTNYHHVFFIPILGPMNLPIIFPVRTPIFPTHIPLYAANSKVNNYSTLGGEGFV